MAPGVIGYRFGWPGDSIAWKVMNFEYEELDNWHWILNLADFLGESIPESYAEDYHPEKWRELLEKFRQRYGDISGVWVVESPETAIELYGTGRDYEGYPVEYSGDIIEVGYEKKNIICDLGGDGIFVINPSYLKEIELQPKTVVDIDFHPITVADFEGQISQLTRPELYELHTALYSQFDTSPIWDTGGTKPQNIRNITYWAKGHGDRIEAVLGLVKKKIEEKAAYPVSGPVPGTKYLTWQEFTALPSYQIIARAVSYPHDYRRKCSPQTKDGYVSVDAIYNMSAWASWKSSSLDSGERAVANEIDNLKLLELMKLNKGRRHDQPALFPVGMLAGTISQEMGSPFVLRTNPELDAAVKHLGYEPVDSQCAPDNIPTDIEVIKESQERLAKYKILSDRELTDTQRATLKLARAIAKEVGGARGVWAADIPGASPRVRTAGLFGTHNHDVFINRFQLNRGRDVVDTDVHELAHGKSDGAVDGSPEHQHFITQVGEEVIKKVKSGKFDHLLRDSAFVW